MPEMTEENYNALMERLDKMQTDMDALKKANADLAAMNRTLIGRTSGTPTEEQVDMKALGEKLMKGLKHA